MTDQQASPRPTYACVRVLSADPLVTISTATDRLPAGIASFAADIVGDRPALHLLHPSWHFGPGQSAQSVVAVEAARKQNPRSDFVLLASDDLEAMNFADAGGRSIVGNGLAMADERVWYPRQVAPTERRFKAVYNAKLDPWKRHELARDVDDLLLITAPTDHVPGDWALARCRKLLPRAVLANYPDNSNKGRVLSGDEIATLLSRAAVGLCLSAVEGCMRASMEYLLCGLPVVSTKSEGGRERYFGTEYCRVVGRDDPEEIARAVSGLAELGLDRHRIRGHVAQILAFERHNLLLALNKLVRRHHGGSDDLFRSFTPFLGAVARYVPVEEARAQIAAAIGTSSAP